MNVSKLTADDLAERVRLLNTPEISTLLNVHEVFTLEKTQRWFDRVKDDPTRYDVTFKVDGDVVGMAGIVHISREDQNGEMYIYIDPRCQGSGHGKEGLSSLINYAFDSLNLEKVYVKTFLSNGRANRFYERLGFVREGLLRRHTLHGGKLEDRCIYSLFRDKQ